VPAVWVGMSLLRRDASAKGAKVPGAGRF
jgi:hypothetical protein